MSSESLIRCSRRLVTRCPYTAAVATISLRVPDSDLERIDRRAVELGVSRTALMLRAVLDKATADEKRFRELEDDIERLRRRLELSGL